jgi:hypothetical protein
MIIKNWNTRKVKEEVKANLERNGEIVGAYVRQDARRRLLRIEQPEWGKKYRRGIVANLIGYTIDTRSNEVAIILTVKPSPDTRHHGFYIEMGSRTHGPQPFLRPAVFENSKIIEKLLENG